jgi:hypothetical protein
MLCLPATASQSNPASKGNLNNTAYVDHSRAKLAADTLCQEAQKLVQ